LTEWAALEFDPAVVRAFLSLAPLNELKSYATQQETEVISQETEEQKDTVNVASALSSEF
jgi:hypothetical protein